MNTEILTESFDQFATRITPTDLALYAGAGLILWILFKDRLSPVQSFVTGLYEKFSSKTNEGKKTEPVVSNLSFNFVPKTNDNIFFDLISSWKKTRDLAVKSGCDQAVKVADDMFPFLSPNACQKTEPKDKAQS